MEATSTISALEAINLMSQVTTLNLGYLGICVSIILFTGGLAGGFYYIFNFKPLQKSIEKQELELKALQVEIDLKLTSLNSDFNKLVSEQTKQIQKSIENAKLELDTFKKGALEKIDKAEKQIKATTAVANSDINSLRRQYREMLLQNFWDQHYMWFGNKVYLNSLYCLVEYMKKALEYKITFLTDLWFSRVADVLEVIKNDEHEKLDNETKNELLTILGSIEGKEKDKQNIKAAIEKLNIVKD